MKLRERNAIELAKKIAGCSQLNYKLGAVVTSKYDDLLTVGVNRWRTHPRQYKAAKKINMGHKIYLHAEIDALRQVRPWMSKPYNIYVVRVIENYNDDEEHFIMRMSKPCPICFDEIKKEGIKNIYYSNNDGVIKFLE